jgi:hypothetical protein
MYQSAFSNDQYDYGMAMGTLLFVVVLTRRSEQRPGHYQGRAASWLSLFSPSTPLHNLAQRRVCGGAQGVGLEPTTGRLLSLRSCSIDELAVTGQRGTLAWLASVR